MRLLSFLMLLWGASLAMAGAVHYEATMADSAWKTTSSPLRCTLSHGVKLFGKGEFYQLAGKQPKFRFFVQQAPVKKGKFSVASHAPDWKHNQKSQDLGNYKYRQGETPFRFKRAMSLRLLSELEKGMSAIFYFKDWGDGKDDVSAVLSPVRFREALGKYRVCMAQIIPYDYEKIKHTRVNFVSAKYTLTSRARRQLDAVATFLLRDPSVKKVYVSGHTDNLGTHSYNNLLSEQRARVVREYLLKKKVPVSKMFVKYFGKRKPTASNNTKKGRAANRRVRVELVRE